MEAEGWGEKEICTKTVKNKEKAGDGGVNTTFPCPPTLTIHFDSKSNMASGINNCELITLTCPHETHELQNNTNCKSHQILV